MVNSYATIVVGNKQRLLNLYDTDCFSATYGYGDRLFWGWKVTDFANGTLQGGAHALAVLVRDPEHKAHEPQMLELIKSIVRASGRVRTNKGSMAEAYPGEHSFCVTALVAFDLLSAIDILEDRVESAFRQEVLEVVRPMIRFITKEDEKHAVISNHLATGVAAIAKWNKLTGKHNPRATELLNIIYQHQSEEGWYREYEGADPGYQTLCTYYLASAYLDTQDARLKDSLSQSAAFLKHFVHIDGTIGGLYGSRNTEVYYPGGIIALAAEIKDFAAMAKALHQGIEANNHLLPEHIDTGNYTPHLNSYAFAALHFDHNKAAIEQVPDLKSEGEQQFPEAGLLVKNTARYQAIINYKKGGTIKVFDKNTGRIDAEEGSYFGKLKNGGAVTTQVFIEQTFEQNRIETIFYRVNASQPTPFTTIILRLLGMTVFKSIFLGNIFKQKIVKMLMTGKRPAGGKLIRSFAFEQDKITVRDQVTPPSNVLSCERAYRSRAMHMASSGYFIPQALEAPEQPQILQYE